MKKATIYENEQGEISSVRVQSWDRTDETGLRFEVEVQEADIEIVRWSEEEGEYVVIKDWADA